MANGNGKGNGFWKGVVVGVFAPVVIGAGVVILGGAAAAVGLATGKRPNWDGKGTFNENGS